MRKNLALALSALILSAGMAVAQDDPVSSAAERFFTVRPGGSAPASPYDFGGDKCEDVPEGAPVWWGRFAGGKARSRGSDNGSRFMVHSSHGCFPSARACEAWMYALKSKYSGKPVYNQCRRGYDPGAPVPPWWAPENRM